MLVACSQLRKLDGRDRCCSRHSHSVMWLVIAWFGSATFGALGKKVPSCCRSREPAYVADQKAAQRGMGVKKSAHLLRLLTGGFEVFNRF